MFKIGKASEGINPVEIKGTTFYYLDWAFRVRGIYFLNYRKIKSPKIYRSKAPHKTRIGVVRLYGIEVPEFSTRAKIFLSMFDPNTAQLKLKGFPRDLFEPGHPMDYQFAVQQIINGNKNERKVHETTSE